jgi:imidazolonepropionase-like amidohydrolase
MMGSGRGAVRLALVTALLAWLPAAAGEGVLALVGGRLVDGTGAAAVPSATVVVEGERIRAAGPSDTVPVPAGARTIDASGWTVLPGFVNGHVHLTFTDAGRGPRTRWVEEGVTAVCDLAAPIDDIPSLKRSAELEPRVIVAGPIVSVPEGYPGSHWGPGIHLSVRGADDARARVAGLLDRGADLVKIALEAARPRGLPMLSDDELAAVVAVAHARGTRVVAHVDGAANLERAVDHGVDAAVHMVRDRLPDALVEKLVARRFPILPTLAVFGARPVMIDNLRRFAAAGGRVALGDDWGNPGTATGLPWTELALFERAGLTPMQIIVAGTRESAFVCNRDRDLGTVEPGKLADLLVVAGNPVDDLQALRNVVLVLKGGRVVGPAGRRPDTSVLE